MAFAARSSAAAAAALALALLAGAAGADGAPRRVVSMNVCTDQLAMLIAGEGQLLSVSHLAADPRVSAMVDEAAGFAVNHGRAEEIFLMDPGLVLVGAHSGRAAAEMLGQLGVRVETFAPAESLDEVADRIRQMGRALGREDRAGALAAEFEARLGRLRADVAVRPRAALYYANGYTLGDRTLAGQILDAAGFANVAAEAGLRSGGVMPLEVLVMAEPEVLILGRPYPGASRAEEILAHPVLGTLGAGPGGAIADRDWVCGTPFVLRAVEELGRVRDGAKPGPR